MVDQRVLKVARLQLLSVQKHVGARHRCLVSEQMISEWVAVLTRDAIAFAKQVQKMLGLAIWFRTMAIDCTNLKHRVSKGFGVLVANRKANF